ncbi:MAG: membrane protein insertase YidC [Spirochaetales bacterium]|nr:membrane protein insertase YidC [Leptospiraceae bacterium]MCP5482255.1 membrane protein insertase YidC [Spirochaetales bacterium]MCP5484633.1 membrane protein insertase YidC [Spirochaetales bacterium]
MENKGQEAKPGSSFLPVLLLGGAVVLGLQLFGGGESGTNGQSPAIPQVPALDQRDQARAAGLADFTFPAGAGSRLERIDTGNHIIFLDARGARIDRLYVKSHDQLQLPDTVIERQADETGRQEHALEITRHNGMDFQFHMYFRDDAGARLGWQLADPPLNSAAFRETGRVVDEEHGLYEFVYVLPVSIGAQRLEITKIFRFYRNENFFHQLSILRNVSANEFRLTIPGTGTYADLFFRTFGDLGPAAESEDTKTKSSYTRFFYYNDSVVQRINSAGDHRSGGGCHLPFVGCRSADDSSGLYTRVVNYPDTLEFMGATSRYFFAYTEFLRDQAKPEHLPDGYIYLNPSEPTGKLAYTAVFREVRLAPAAPTSIDTGSIRDILTDDGGFVSADQGNRARIVQQQRTRRDAIIVDTRVFVGPRTSEAHQFQRPELAAADFGAEEPNPEAGNVIYANWFYAMFSGIQSGIVWIMRWLYGLVGNYGWCIILIAGVFKLLTFPLNQMQVKSMRKMSALKPEMERLNEQYGDDPQKKQQKLMELYKKHNINPAKGCLPILIQMPVFIALYSAFSESIELWHSPFILWMQDLSLPDTVATLPVVGLSLNILPLVMAVSQVLQQRFTTVATDPQQKMLMYMMPFMMLFFFWQMPSGVTLYWTVQNLIQILWQVIGNRFGKDEPVVSTPKKGGSGGKGS